MAQSTNPSVTPPSYIYIYIYHIYDWTSNFSRQPPYARVYLYVIYDIDILIEINPLKVNPFG